MNFLKYFKAYMEWEELYYSGQGMAQVNQIWRKIMTWNVNNSGHEKKKVYVEGVPGLNHLKGLFRKHQRAMQQKWEY